MAESHLDQMSKLEIISAPAVEEACVWEKLPRELQYKVLCHLPLQTLFQVRCVCKAWRYFILRRAFASMYDGMHSTVPPSVALVYTNLLAPNSIKWSMYDYDQNTWQQMTTLPPHSHLRLDQKGTFYSVYPVGGLLVFRIWKMGKNSWVVWNPLTNKCKVLPPCKNRTRRTTTVFVHAFVADESAKRYKILMAHNPYTWGYGVMGTSMVTELYDSATRVWAQSESPLQASLSTKSPYYYVSQTGDYETTYSPDPLGVLINGLIYFVTSQYAGESVLLKYNIESEQWHDEATVGICQKIFEWDGHLMVVGLCSRIEEGDEILETILCDWAVRTTLWPEAGIRVPNRMINIGYDLGVGCIVAQGNHLVLGQVQDHFASAAYVKSEDCWTCTPPICGPIRDQERGGICSLLLFKPRLDWTP